MKAFVFKENNEFIGRFEVAGPDDIDSGFASFVAANPVKPYSYIECAGREWTVMSSGNELLLTQGREVWRPAGSPPLDAPAKRKSSSIVIRFVEGYSAAKETIGLGNFIKCTGIVVAIIGYIMAFVMSREAILIIGSILSATVTGFILYAIGAMLATHGRILKATLDTAANTSPNLDDEERSHLMSITPGE